MKKIIYLFVLFSCVQIVLAQQDSSYLPLAVGNYWRLGSGSLILEWKVVGDTIFSKRGKYFILQGESLEYVRKADNGDIMTYFPQCDSEFVRYPFSFPFDKYPTSYHYKFPRYNSYDCGASWEMYEEKTGIGVIEISSFCCDLVFKKSLGFWSYYNGSEILGLSYYILNNPTVNVKSILASPDNYLLYQNYPNPFNSQTKIRFSLKQSGHVNLTIYGILGQKVCVLVDEVKESGSYEVLWDSKNSNGKNLSSGIYFYNMLVNSKTGNESYSETKFMFLNK